MTGDIALFLRHVLRRRFVTRRLSLMTAGMTTILLSGRTQETLVGGSATYTYASWVFLLSAAGGLAMAIVGFLIIRQERRFPQRAIGIGLVAGGPTMPVKTPRAPAVNVEPASPVSPRSAAPAQPPAPRRTDPAVAPPAMAGGPRRPGGPADIPADRVIADQTPLVIGDTVEVYRGEWITAEVTELLPGGMVKVKLSSGRPAFPIPQSRARLRLTERPAPAR